MGLREGLMLGRMLRYGDVEAQQATQQMAMRQEEMKLRKKALDGEEAAHQLKLAEYMQKRGAMSALAQSLLREGTQEAVARESGEGTERLPSLPPGGTATSASPQSSVRPPPGFSSAPQETRTMALALFNLGKADEAMKLLMPYMDTPMGRQEEEKRALELEKTRAEIEKIRRGERPATPFQALLQQGLPPEEAARRAAAAAQTPPSQMEQIRLYMQKEEHDAKMQKMRLDIIKAQAEGEGQIPPAEQRKLQLDVRRSIRDEPAFKDFSGARLGYNSLLTGAKLNNAAGDLAIVNGLQRMMDPGVSVRTEDFRTIQSSQGLIDQIQNIIPRLEKGDKLAPNVRKKFLELGQNLMQEWVAAAKADIEPIYGRTIQDTGLSLDDIFVDPRKSLRPSPEQRDEGAEVAPRGALRQGQEVTVTPPDKGSRGLPPGFNPRKFTAEDLKLLTPSQLDELERQLMQEKKR